MANTQVTRRTILRATAASAAIVAPSVALGAIINHGNPDPVVKLLGVEQLATRDAALEHDGLEHGAAGIERGAHPRRPCADDDDVVSVRGSQKVLVR